MTGTELGCRSLFRVNSDPALLQKVNQQIYSWCKEKDWDPDLIDGPGIVEVAPGVNASLVRDELRDGRTLERRRFHQDEGQGLWITQVTTVADRNNDGWVWTDVLQPSGREARVPRLVRNTLGVVEGLDGSHRLTAEPFRAGVEDVDYIYDALLDPQRRGFLFIAGSDETLVVPQSRWATFVAKLLSQTRGIASGYVLDADATRALNARLPLSHRVGAWSVRTFTPEPEFDDPRDSVRHRILTTNRIINDSEHHVRALLARSACRHSTTFAVPRELVRIDRQLREMLDELIVGQASHTPELVTESVADTTEEIHEERTASPEREIPHPVREDRPSDSAVVARLKSVVRTVVGTAEITVDAVTRLGELASEALGLQRNLSLVRERIRTLESERAALEDTNTKLAQRDADGQAELADLRIDFSSAERDLAHFRAELAKLDREGTATWVREKTATDDPPDSFDNLIERIAEFDCIVFTGDAKIAVSLDEHNLFDWAIRTCDALRALNDYCQQRSSGQISCSVDDYIAKLPNERGGLTPGNHAKGETRATQDHPKYGPARTFSVPDAVDPKGAVFMGAHVRIAKYSGISPRMHYYNDAAGTGKIYVGYIGPHLPNFRTN